MSGLVSGRIITDGLIFYVDSANQKSYSAGSGTWNSMDEKYNSMPLYGGPTYSSSNSGIISFDNVNDYVGASQLFSPSIRNGDVPGEIPNIDFELTFEIALRIEQTLSGITLAILDTTGTSFNNVTLAPLYRLTITGTNRLNSVAGYKKVSSGYATCLHTADYNLNQWYHVTMSMRKTSATTGEWFLMRNGTILSQQTLSDISYWCNYSSAIDDRGNQLAPQSNYFSHSRGFVRVYNKGLTQDQALQNFNATRNRFGI